MGKTLESFLLVVQTSLTTLSGVAAYIVWRYSKNASSDLAASAKIVNDIKHAHNAQSDTIENVILKLSDLETHIAMHRKNAR
jgi:uncharacterized protein (UPF0333 family)